MVVSIISPLGPKPANIRLSDPAYGYCGCDKVDTVYLDSFFCVNFLVVHTSIIFFLKYCSLKIVNTASNKMTKYYFSHCSVSVTSERN